MGVSHASNRHVERLSKTAMDQGAAGVMLAPVANLKTDDQVYHYYAGVAKLLGPSIPICLQDFPQATGWVADHAVEYSLATSLAILLVFVPLSLWRYRTVASR